MVINELESYLRAVSSPRFDWIQIEVSALCNASCSYCVLTCYKGDWGGGLMDMDTFNRLKPSFTQENLVYLQGWGEPLIHPRFWDMVKEVRSSGAKVGFTTNGTRLDDNNLTKVLELQVDIMGISLAGTTAQTSRQFRSGCDFDFINSALRWLKEMKQTANQSKPSVHLAYMLLKSNWQEIVKLPALAAQWGVDQIVINQLSFVANQSLQTECLFYYPELWPRIAQSLDKAGAEAKQLNIDFHYYLPDRDKPNRVCTENVLNACFVSFRGAVSPCVLTNISVKEQKMTSHYFGGREYPVEYVCYGNINEQPLQRIWRSDSARHFHSAFEHRLNTGDLNPKLLPNACRHCYKLFESLD